VAIRGVIARPHGNGWQGVYFHNGAWPHELGWQLWQAFHSVFDGDAGAMRKALIDDHPGGWSQWQVCYCHERDPDGGDAITTSDDPDPLSLEWIWIISDQDLTVLAHRIAQPDEPGAVNYDHLDLAYKHVQVASLPWNGPEPDWTAMEEQNCT
jgi:hypothetical protein